MLGGSPGENDVKKIAYKECDPLRGAVTGLSKG